MPVFKSHTTLNVARNLRVFLNLEAGLTRAEPAPGQTPEDRGLARQREVESRNDGEARSGGVNSENIIWIFGAGRTGSTWLAAMMSGLEGQALWSEPWVGALFGRYYYHVDERKHQAPNFILGRNRQSWLRSIRNFVLDEARTRFPRLSGEDYLVIKEPNGSMGAPLMMGALPESRMILLVRDPRDVVASSMDALEEGGWNFERNEGRTSRQREALPEQLVLTRRRAAACLSQMGKAKEAYDAHAGRKALVRYEDLVADTLGTMKRMYTSLGMEVPEQELERVVREHSWENIPEEKKGEGKFYRKGKPGSWREDLTSEQAEVVEQVTAPLIAAFYS